MANPARGEIWTADLDPVVGHEQGGKRPVLVVSADAMNAGPLGLVAVLPVTSRLRGWPTHVAVAPPEGGLTRKSAVMCEQPRTIAAARLGRRLGTVDAATLAAVGKLLARVLDL